MAKIKGAKIDLEDFDFLWKNKKADSKDKVVKIEGVLLDAVEDYINKGGNRLKYVNKKQFIDLAVFEKLKREVKK